MTGQADKSYIQFPPIVHVGASPSRRDIVCIDEEELIVPVKRGQSTDLLLYLGQSADRHLYIGQSADLLLYTVLYIFIC